MKDASVYLRHILDAIRQIEEYTAPGREAFDAERMRRDAVIRNLEIIGEAVRMLPAEVRSTVPDVDWGDVIGIRNWLIHGYATVDLALVWSTVTRDVPILRAAVERLLSDQDSRA